ncbi:MAG: hypothetical protein LBC02_00025 [Planctomycetaceae bacterium]|jgi:hypothetical protein|nr:hypothetical protein [Planctomycetaceae bacterium]
MLLQKIFAEHVHGQPNGSENKNIVPENNSGVLTAPQRILTIIAILEKSNFLVGWLVGWLVSHNSLTND